MSKCRSMWCRSVMFTLFFTEASSENCHGPENMRRWIEDPKAVDSLTAMPNVGVTPSDARHLTAYLYTLR